MLFNSIDFALFLPLVFLLYWFVFNKSIRAQNILIVAASYLFYGWWDWRFLMLVLFSTVVDYTIGIQLSKTENPSRRKSLILISILVNLGFLGFFKYFNFFVENFTTAFTFFGGEIKSSSLKIILPVGISFYTFQTLSYSIDVFRKKLNPTKDFIAFSAFVCFFPQLVAGPIERATNLLPQFYRERKFDYSQSIDGLRQMLWGFFKKIVIADSCAEYANLIFNNSGDYSGSTLFLGAVFFAFQIYGDFSGYSDIAIGTSRLLGFNLMQNFAFPYFSRDIAEFWRRWHMSLSTWFRDYIYIPLGGSRCRSRKKIRNTFIIFLVSGFWHGANWTFIIWGLIHALYFLPLLLINRNRSNIEIVAKGKLLPSISDILRMLLTFTLTTLAWVFFRADSVQHAFQIISGIISPSLFSTPEVTVFKPVALIGLFLLIEWFGREDAFALEHLGVKWNKFIRWFMYAFIIYLIITLMKMETSPFIYFQF